MGVGPVTPWRLARGDVVWARIRTPLRVGLAAGAVLVLTGTRNGWVVGAVMLSTFVASVIVRHLWVTSRARAVAKIDIPLRRAALDVVSGDPGYWGGQLSHIGVALAAVWPPQPTSPPTPRSISPRATPHPSPGTSSPTSPHSSATSPTGRSPGPRWWSSATARWSPSCSRGSTSTRGPAPGSSPRRCTARSGETCTSP